MKYIIFSTLLIISCSSSNVIKRSLTYHPHIASEGDIVMVGNPNFAPFIEKKLTYEGLLTLEKTLRSSLEIPITERGFVQAANREGDDTNYDAIWVRDSVWVYFSMLESGQTEKARKIILALWDYYSSPDQISRFRSVIRNPSLSMNPMMVPHIRFNGKDPNFSDVLKNGKPEEWNHRQNDAHGLFMLGVATGYEQGLLKDSDFTLARKMTLDLFVPYMSAIEYWNYPDAGAWEEISRINTSSIAMVVKALENSQALQKNKLVTWNPSLLNRLIDQGYKRIRTQLSQGGESPSHPPGSPEYRREDAALFNIFLPFPLKKLDHGEKLLTLTILEKLIRPYGVIRYPLDSYQSGNYWVKDKRRTDLPELTGDSSTSAAFKARFGQFIPGTEAQWFFDSKLTMIYLQLAQSDSKYLHQAKLHFKRALGQVTAADGKVIAADGKPAPNLSFPESVNTLVHDGRWTQVPSPITPLNWAKASFSMALKRMKDSLSSKVSTP